MLAYGTDDGYVEWLTARGYCVPVDVPAPSVMRMRGSVYVDGTYGGRFVGKPTGGALQDREWPRTGVPGVPSDAVPQRVIEAAYAAAWHESVNPGTLAAVMTPGRRIVRARVEGAVDVSYADDGEKIAIIMSIVEGFLAPLLRVGAMPAIAVV